MINFLFRHKRNGVKARLWSARIRLDGWAKPRTFGLHVTDKRVAQQKLAELLRDLEQEAAGIGTPRSQRNAAHTPLLQHHQAFVADVQAMGRSANTLTKYRQSLPKLFERCRWKELRDVTADSFVRWRRSSDLSPKSLNDLLATATTFFLWMQRQGLLAANPLKDVPKISYDSGRRFRRALSVDEIKRLLAVAPVHRAAVYQTIVYTGLRREEVNRLKWGDFDFTADPVRLTVPSSISKNRKESTHFLRPELARTLSAFRPAHAKPADPAFRGCVPRVPTLKGDLKAAGIPFEDERGRRVDLHALRTTYGTLLSASGVAPRVAMELMRHSDLKLTMKVYTDTAQLPLLQETARLPSFELADITPATRVKRRGPRAVVQGEKVVPLSTSSPVTSRQGAAAAPPTVTPLGDLPDKSTQISTHEAVVSGRERSEGAATGRNEGVAETPGDDALRREKTAGVASGGLSKMEQAKRLELSTSTLARWCSTN